MPHAAWPAFIRSLLSLLGLCMLLFPSTVTAQATNPYGDCCVSRITMTSADTWQVTCGSCATNPGNYSIRQPTPEVLLFVGPDGVSAPSRFEAAKAICRCPSQKTRRDRERLMRRFDGN